MTKVVTHVKTVEDRPMLIVLFFIFDIDIDLNVLIKDSQLTDIFGTIYFREFILALHFTSTGTPEENDVYGSVQIDFNFKKRYCNIHNLWKLGTCRLHQVQLLELA